MVYNCLRCGYRTNIKIDIVRHLNRKKECKQTVCIIDRETCLRYIKSEITFSFLKEQLDLLRKEKDNEIEKLKNQLVTVSGQIGNHNKIDRSIVNSNVINNIDIHKNNYHQTDYNVLQNGAINCIKQNREFDFGKFLKLLHFNRDFPQNHNICIINKKDKTIHILYNGKFIEYNKGRKGLELILKEKLEFIEQHEELFDSQIFEASKKLKNDYFKILDDKEKTKFLYEDVYLPLYNDRTLVLERKR